MATIPKLKAVSVSTISITLPGYGVFDQADARWTPEPSAEHQSDVVRPPQSGRGVSK